MIRLRVEVTADRRFGTNSYLVEDQNTGDAVVIDANFEPELMTRLIRERGAKVRAILLTHTDVDHVAGLAELLTVLGPVPVAVGCAGPRTRSTSRRMASSSFRSTS